MSLFGRLFHSSGASKGESPPPLPAVAPVPSSSSTTSTPASSSSSSSSSLPQPPELSSTFSAFASTDLPAAISFSQARLDSYDPSQPAYNEAEPLPLTGTRQASYTDVRNSSSTLLSSNAPPPYPSSVPSVPTTGSVPLTQPTLTPSPSPPSAAEPAPSHRQSSSISLPFSLLPPGSLSHSHSPFSSFLAGEDDLPLPPELDHLWLLYEEHKASLLALPALEAFARALLPTLPPAGNSFLLAAGGHPARVLLRLKAEVVVGWPEVKKAVSDAILGRQTFARVPDLAGESVKGEALGEADVVAVCASLGPSFLPLYLLHRLFVFPHNRRLLMRMDWMPWMLKLSQLMASQYQASHQSVDSASDDADGEEKERKAEQAEQAGTSEMVADDAEPQVADAVADGPLEEDGSFGALRSSSGSSSSSRPLSTSSAESEQQQQEADRRKAESVERRSSARRLHVYLECGLIVCLNMCALVVDGEDDWRKKSTRRLTLSHAPSTLSSAASSASSSAFTSPLAVPTSAPLTSVPPLHSHGRTSSDSFREGHGNRTTVLDDSGLPDVLTALLRLLTSTPISCLTYSQFALIRATVQAMGAVSFDNKKVQWLLIQQSALDAICQTLRWEKNEAEATHTPSSGAGEAGHASSGASLHSKSSLHRLTDRATVDALFGQQEREEQPLSSDGSASSTSSFTATSASTSPSDTSSPASIFVSQRSRTSSLYQPGLPPLSISLFHVQLLALQVVRELTCQQLPSCWEFMHSTGLPSILHSLAWIIHTFHRPLSSSSAADAITAIQSLNASLTSTASSLLSSLSAQQCEVDAEDGQSLFSLVDFRMASLSSSTYSSRIDPSSLTWAHNPWLAQLFDGVLLPFLICPDVVVTQSSSFFAMFSSRSTLANVDPHHFISYHVLQLLLSLFDDSQHAQNQLVLKVRLRLKQSRVSQPADSTVASPSSLLLPSVQLHCLSMMREATTVKPSIIPFLRSRGLYSLFFQPSYFYFFPNPPPTPSPLSPSLSLTPDLQRLLRVSVVDLLVHCVVGDPSGDLDAQVVEMRYLLSSYRFSLSADEIRAEDGRHALDMSKALIDLFTVRRHHVAVVLIATMDAAQVEEPPVSAAPSPAQLSLPFGGLQRSAFTLDTPIPHLWTLLLARQHALARQSYESSLPPPLWSAVLQLLEHVVLSSQAMAARLLRDDAFCLQLSELMKDADNAQRRAAMRMILALMTSVGPPGDEEHSPTHAAAAPSPGVKPHAPAPSSTHRRTKSTALPTLSSPASHPSHPIVSVPTSPTLGSNEPARVTDELQRNKRLLFARYLELFGPSTPPSLAAAEDALAGLRKLLSVHTRSHQDILRRRHALQLVTNVLALALRGEGQGRRDEARRADATRAVGLSPPSAYSALSFHASPTSFPSLYRTSSSTVDAVLPSLHRDRSAFSPTPAAVADFPMTREGGGSEGSSIVPSAMPSPALPPTVNQLSPPALRPALESPSPPPSSASSALTRDGCVRLCVSVLLTLTSLLSGNRRSMDLFRRSIGYELLTDLLVHCESGHPSRQVTTALLHLLVDGHFQLQGHDLRTQRRMPSSDDDGSSSPADSSAPSSMSGSVRFSAASSEMPSTAVSSVPSPVLSAQPSSLAFGRSQSSPTQAKDDFSFSPFISPTDASASAPSVPPISSRLSRALNSLPTLPDRYLFVNADALIVLFSRHRFLRCSRSHQGDQLSLFNTLIGLSSLNAAFAARVSFIDLISDLFPHFPPLLQSQPEKESLQVQAISLIQQCGHYSISVKQLKRFIALLRSQTVQLRPDQLSAYSVHLHSTLPSRVASPTASTSAPIRSLQPPPDPSSSTQPASVPPDGVSVQVRPFWTVAALEALEWMSGREGPDNFLFLDGVQGGLSLPPLQAFPSRGWSISTWIRIESFSPPPPSFSHVQRYAYSAADVAPVAFIPFAVLSRLSPLARLTALSAYRSSASAASTPSSTASSTPRARPASASHHPRLLQLITSASNGFGLDVHFTDRRLAVSVLAGKGHAHTLLIENSALKEQQWYHLAITQSAPPTFGTSELRVYVDGHCTHTSTTLRYPTANKPLKHAFIGTDGVRLAVGEEGGEGQGGKVAQCLHGQLGPFYFLDDAVSATQVKAMHALGAGYLFTSATGEQQLAEMEAEERLADADSLRSPSDAHPMQAAAKEEQPQAFPASQRKRSSLVAQSSQTLTVARQISSRILLAYNAKARDGRLHINIAPRVQDEAEKAKQAEDEGAASPSSLNAQSRWMHAMALEGTFQCVTRHVLDVLSCLNGIACLFPVFTQLDQPVHRCSEVSDEEREQRRRHREEELQAAAQLNGEEEERTRQAGETSKEMRRAASLQAKLQSGVQEEEDHKSGLQPAEADGRVITPAPIDVESKQPDDPQVTTVVLAASDATREPFSVGEADEEEEEEEEVDGDEESDGDDGEVGEAENEGEEGLEVGDEEDHAEGEQDDVVPDLASPAHFTRLGPGAATSTAITAHHRLPSDTGDLLSNSWSAAESGLDVSKEEDALMLDVSHSPQESLLLPTQSLPLSQRPAPPRPTLAEVHSGSSPPLSTSAHVKQRSAQSPFESALADLPPLPVPSPPSLSLDYKVHLAYDLEPRLLPSLLRTLLAVFSDNLLQLSYMQTYRGFYLLAYQLEHSSPRHLSLKALHIIEKLLLASRPSPRLYRSAFFALLCNLRLWLYVTPSVQRGWLRLLCQVVLKAPWLIRHASGSQRILDQLRSTCWFDSEADSVALRRELLHPVTHAVIGVRPFAANLHVLRSELLNILHVAITAHSSAPITAAVQLQSSIDPITLHLPAPEDDEDDDPLAVVPAALSDSDVQSLVLSLQSLSDDEQKVDLLQLLATWLQGDDSSMVLKTLAELDQPEVSIPQDVNSRLRQQEEEALPRGGMDLFLSTLQSSNSAARVLSLRCLHKLLRSGVKLPEKELFVAILNILRAEEDHRQDAEERQHGERRRQQLQLDGGVSLDAASRVLHAKNASQGVLDEALYLALMSLMLNELVDEESVKEMRHGLFMEDAVILHVTILQVLFSLIAMQTSVKRNRVQRKRPTALSMDGDGDDMVEDGDGYDNPWTTSSLHHPAVQTSDDLLVSCMQDLQFLLLYSDSNKTLVLEQWAWPSWLFALMVEPAQHRRQAAAARRPMSASISSSSFGRPSSGSRPASSPTPQHDQADGDQQPAGPRLTVMTIIHDDDDQPQPSVTAALRLVSPAPLSHDPSFSAALASSTSFITTASGPLFSYAQSVFEHLLFYALHKPMGWKTYERCLVWLSMYTFSPSPSPLPHFPAASTPCYHPLPILQILRATLFSLHQTLRKQTEVRSTPPDDLATLLDNIQQLTAITETFLLHRLSAYSQLIDNPYGPTPSPAPSPTGSRVPERSPVGRGVGMGVAVSALVSSSQAVEGGAAPSYPPLEPWVLAEMMAMIEGEMTAVWPLVELLLGIQAWLVLLRQQAVDDKSAAAALQATQALEAEQAAASRSMWRKLSSAKSSASTPVKPSSRRDSLIPPSSSAHYARLQERERESLLHLVVKLVQCTSTHSSALFSMLFATTRADDLLAIMQETFFDRPPPVADISSILARYSTPDRVRSTHLRRETDPHSVKAEHRRAVSAFDAAAAEQPVPALATAAASEPSSPKADGEAAGSSLRSSLCTLLSALAEPVSMWSRMEGQPIDPTVSADSRAVPQPPAPAASPSLLEAPTATPPERLPAPLPESSRASRSASSPSSMALQHPLREYNLQCIHTSTVSMRSVLTLLLAVLRLTVERCTTATFLVPGPAPIAAALSQEDAAFLSPSPQPMSGTLSTTSSSQSPPSSPTRSSPSSASSPLTRRWQSSPGKSATDDERVKEKTRLKLISQSLGLESAGAHSAQGLLASPSPAAASSPVTGSGGGGLFASPFASLLRSSPAKSTPLQSSAAVRKSPLRVVTDTNAQLTFASVTFSLPPEAARVVGEASKASRMTGERGGGGAGGDTEWLRGVAAFFLDSPAWLRCAEVLKPVSAYLLQSEGAELRQQVSAFKRSAAYLLDLHTTVQHTDAQQYAVTRMHVDALRLKQTQAEAARRQHVRLQHERKRRGEQQTWSLILRAVTNERGAWSRDDPSTLTFWKLDETENASRMRMKTKLHYTGSRHLEAAHTEGYNATTQPPTAVHKPSSTSNADLVAALSGPEGVPAEVAEELVQMALLFSRSQAGAIAPEASATSGQHGAHADEHEFDTLSEAAEAQEKDGQAPQLDSAPVYAVQCVMVHPADKFSGQLTLTGSLVLFEAREEVEVRRRGRKRASNADEMEGKKAKGRDQAWPLSSITAIHYRRHALQRNSLELFFAAHAAAFLTFSSEQHRDATHLKLLKGIRAARRNSPQVDALMQSYARPHVFPYLPFLYSSSKSLFGGPYGGAPPDVLRKSGLTLAWQRRQLSNFDYLMQLNTIAGRTFNDLSQYPVFPWILADYTSTTLDFTDDTRAHLTFRDLSKPIGALNPERLQHFVERYRGLEKDNDPSLPPFLYGSCYSSSGSVLFYLLRVEPFTSAAIALQDGHFDHADRLFASVAKTWQGVLDGPADVKELTPEWFFLPEMFRNENRLPLGRSQQGVEVDDVQLPPWAQGSAEQFVRVQREALESEYVSQRLHHWIDLIFGYKQRGKEAEAAHNVFFHLTYEGAVDLEAIDPALRAATVAQILHFGQVPMQLLPTAHPQRFSLHQLESTERLLSIFPSLHQLQLYHDHATQRMTTPASVDNPLLFIYAHHTSDRLLTLGLDRVLSVHKWRNSSPSYFPPYTLDVEKRKGTRRRRRIGVHFAVGLNLLPSFFAVSRCERYLLSAGHWDNSLRVSNVSGGQLHQSLTQHKDCVTCIAQSETGDFVVTGSKDATVIVWANHQFVDRKRPEEGAVSAGLSAGLSAISAMTGQTVAVPSGAGGSGGGGGGAGSKSHQRRSAQHFELLLCDRPRHVLYGHDDEVSCVWVSSQFDLVASGGRDGSILLHTLRSGRYTRTIPPPTTLSSTSTPSAVRFLFLTVHGTLVAYWLQSSTLATFSINGRLLHSTQVGDRLFALLLTPNGQFVLGGGEEGVVRVWRVSDLVQVQQLGGSSSGGEAAACIRCLCLTANEQHLLVGTSRGGMLIYALDQHTLTNKLLRRLQNVGL